jgi:hypothetical protein
MYGTSMPSARFSFATNGFMCLADTLRSDFDLKMKSKHYIPFFDDGKSRGRGMFLGFIAERHFVIMSVQQNRRHSQLWQNIH